MSETKAFFAFQIACPLRAALRSGQPSRFLLARSCREFTHDPVRPHLWQECKGIGLSEADSLANIQAYLDRDPGMSFIATAGGAVLCRHEGDAATSITWQCIPGRAGARSVAGWSTNASARCEAPASRVPRKGQAI